MCLNIIVVIVGVNERKYQAFTAKDIKFTPSTHSSHRCRICEVMRHVQQPLSIHNSQFQSKRVSSTKIDDENDSFYSANCVCFYFGGKCIYLQPADSGELFFFSPVFVNMMTVHSESIDTQTFRQQFFSKTAKIAISIS